MLAEIYIEALLADPDLADQVWEAWFAGEISDFVAVWLWWTIVTQNAMNLNPDSGIRQT